MSENKQVTITLDKGHEATLTRYRELVRMQMGYTPTRPQAVKALMSIGAQRFQPPAPVEAEKEQDDAEA